MAVVNIRAELVRKDERVGQSMGIGNGKNVKFCTKMIDDLAKGSLKLSYYYWCEKKW